ncbi:MAG: D-alanyl-D-alanine carboxypeptidase [Firmicutes bacterium]|nr:D-alanyl-D-alanine carboxypeptidase [Bacillota bacterium]
MRKIICFLISCAMLLFQTAVFAENVETDAKAVILIEQSTGDVLYEENADEQLPIASVTKIMTMLLIMEDIDSGVMSLDDMVSVSPNAMSYGGSTMFLEAGEELSVNDMLKGIAVASANDGCVAMAEHMTGSESAFVEKMNEKAAELGMANTHFSNTNGLDDDTHYSSARDVAIMSRELLTHEKIFDYTTIWTDSLRDGKFELANTNKLIRYYDGANGLKTGSTSKALCCISASAKRDNMQLIAVVLGAPTSDERFKSARNLLDYGFANYSIDTLAEEGEEIERVTVAKGVAETVGAVAAENCSALFKRGESKDAEREVVLDDKITAPVKAGDKIGTLSFSVNGKTIAQTDLLAAEDVNKKGIGLILKQFFINILGGIL